MLSLSVADHLAVCLSKHHGVSHTLNTSSRGKFCKAGDNYQIKSHFAVNISKFPNALCDNVNENKVDITGNNFHATKGNIDTCFFPYQHFFFSFKGSHYSN